MPLSKDEKARLERKAHELRRLSLETVIWAGSGHIGGALSAMDIMTILYHKYMHIDPKNPGLEDRDRFVCSKGHIGVGYAPVLADLGYFDPALLKEYNHTGSPLGMHLDSLKVPGVEGLHGLPRPWTGDRPGARLGRPHQGPVLEDLCPPGRRRVRRGRGLGERHGRSLLQGHQPHSHRR